MTKAAAHVVNYRANKGKILMHTESILFEEDRQAAASMFFKAQDQYQLALIEQCEATPRPTRPPIDYDELPEEAIHDIRDIDGEIG
jgi:hypothetical protein